jgi:hypothetical protein
VAKENARWNSDKMTVEIKLIGDRPAGIVEMDSPIVQATQRAVATITRGRAASPLAAPAPIPTSRCRSAFPPSPSAAAARAATGIRATNGTSRPMPGWDPQHALLTVLMLSGLDGVDEARACGEAGGKVAPAALPQIAATNAAK